nr:hypothetical protein [Duganella qianjiadongensis]
MFSRFGKTGTAPVAGTGPAAPLTAEQQRELAMATARKIDEIEAAMAADIFPPAAQQSQPATPEEELPHAAAAPETAVLADEIAILYSQGQYQLAAQLLRDHLAQAAEPGLWWLLFDLYQLLDQRDAFDALSLVYAQRFETSPPDWSASAPATPPAARLTLEPRQIAGETAQATLLATLQASPEHLRLSGAEALAATLRGQLASDPASRSATPWLLLLELLQRLDRETEFELIALEYCAAFEVSPPAFRPRPVAPAQPRSVQARPAAGDAFELPLAMHAPLGALQSRIIAYAAQQPRLIFDGSRLRQLDYLCAQQLLACLGNLPVSSIEFRHVSHLVAALLRLQGYSRLARIVPRHN